MLENCWSYDKLIFAYQQNINAINIYFNTQNCGNYKCLFKGKLFKCGVGIFNFCGRCSREWEEWETTANLEELTTQEYFILNLIRPM